MVERGGRLDSDSIRQRALEIIASRTQEKLTGNQDGDLRENLKLSMKLGLAKNNLEFEKLKRD